MQKPTRHKTLTILAAFCISLAGTAVQAEKPVNHQKIKKQITDSLSIASAAKLATVEYYVTYGEFPKDNAEANFLAPESMNTQAIKSVTIVPPGKIVIAYTELINPQAQATITLQMSADDENHIYAWTCTPQNIEKKLIPKECQAQ